VNHRGLDLNIRLPDELRSSEAAYRKIVASRVERGRVDLRIGLEWIGERSWKVEVRDGLAQQLQGALSQLDEQIIAADARLTIGDLLRVPEVLEVEVEKADWTPDDLRFIEEVLQEALSVMLEARRVEGGELLAVLERDLRELESVVSALEGKSEAVSGALLEALRERVLSLLGDSAIPEERIAQETAILVEKSDVREEIDRLRSHLCQFFGILQEGGAVGRRLNFLSQEILRELNTLGSKCRDSEMTADVLDGKVLCEEIREQVQNVE
jgi:uncharacterized protein (TIGR00255 family)